MECRLYRYVVLCFSNQKIQVEQRMGPIDRETRKVPGRKNYVELKKIRSMQKMALYRK